MRTARTKTTTGLRSSAAGCLALLFLLASCGGEAGGALQSPGESSAREARSDFYLALGDSLSVGYQPGRGETRRGYVDELWRTVRERMPELALHSVGCAGETSRSMITGHRSSCRYPAGSQLDAAVDFLHAHPGDVAFITLDIGVNDLIVRCLRSGVGLIDDACTAELLPRLRSRLIRIVDTISSSAGSGVPIVAMTYYDPLLGFWGLVPGGRRLARANERVWAAMNEGIASAYGNAGATVADVARTFRIENFTDTVRVPGRGRIPVNVALACRWTWFCSERFFGDPHANRTGYRRIAHTFDRELRRLLP